MSSPLVLVAWFVYGLMLLWSLVGWYADEIYMKQLQYELPYINEWTNMITKYLYRPPNQSTPDRLESWALGFLATAASSTLRSVVRTEYSYARDHFNQHFGQMFARVQSTVGRVKFLIDKNRQKSTQEAFPTLETMDESPVARDVQRARVLLLEYQQAGDRLSALINFSPPDRVSASEYVSAMEVVRLFAGFDPTIASRTRIAAKLIELRETSVIQSNVSGDIVIQVCIQTVNELSKAALFRLAEAFPDGDEASERNIRDATQRLILQLQLLSKTKDTGK